MNPTSVLTESTVEVAAETYAVITTDDDIPDTFATIRDRQETTHVLQEQRLGDIETQTIKRGWSLLTFDADLPFELVGFLAIVASALAADDVAIFALSAYSTDHLLVQQADLPRALTTLSELGCEVRRL